MGPLTGCFARKLIQGYYSCVSYTDAQIGKVLDALEDLDLAENTIVVLWGDHGWNLREHGLWCKHCLFRTSLRSTLIVDVPWLTEGNKTSGVVEFVDIYPSLCDMAGLEKPGHLQGKSFTYLLEDPSAEGKAGVVSQWFDGLTVNTGDYAYTVWYTDEKEQCSRMLYDHQNDPEENKNISEDPDNQSLISELHKLLHENKGENFWE
ncbi:MAG: sulfatase/phosphatase domain-containing protein [Bacteroidota bacterium]